MSAATRDVATLRILERGFLENAFTDLPLNPGEIHIWQRHLACESDVLVSLRSVLARDELARAERFRFAANRDEYVVARGTLRILLGHYMVCPPDSLRFTYSQYGRPQIDDAGDRGLIEFNISHSGNVVILAFARDRRIGIDIERVRKDFGTTEIAERFFSPTEREALREVPIELRHEAFFRCWTRKEAFIKALGEGLSHPLDQFDVSLAPDRPAALLATRPNPTDASRWSLWNLNVPVGYAGALAAEIAPTGKHSGS